MKLSILSLAVLTFVVSTDFALAQISSKISVTHSGKCIGFKNNSKASNVSATQVDCKSAPVFAVMDLGKETYRLKSEASGKCLEVKAGSKKDGAMIIQGTCSPLRKAQVFKAPKKQNGYQLQTFASKCLDVSGGSTSEGASIIQYSCHNGDNQIWNTATATPAPEPVKLTLIGQENQTFTVGPNVLIRYGTPEKYLEKVVSGTFVASNDFFGKDPVYGVFKSVWIVGAGSVITPPVITPPVVTPPVVVPETPVTDSGVNQYKNLKCEMYAELDTTYNRFKINNTNLGTKKVVCLKAGTYNGLDIDGLKVTGPPVVIQNEGLVQFTGGLWINNPKNVVLSGSGTEGIEHGIIVRDTGYRGIQFAGKVHTFTLQNVAFKNVPNYVIAWDRPSSVYDGTPDSAFYNNKFLRLKGENVGTFVIFYADRDGKKDYILNIEVAYCDVKDSPNMGSGIVLSAAFNVNVHHNRFENVSMKVNEHSGIIFLHGDGKLHHNYFKHTLGNSMRTWPLSLGSVGSLDMYNNISIDTIKYGMIEVQPFADSIKVGGLNYTNIRIYNNTAGNLNHGRDLPAGPALWTAGLVDMYNSMGGKLDIQNNVLFNVNNPRDQTFFINGQGYWVPDLMTMKNNLYFDSAEAAGIKLPTGMLESNSPVINQGDSLPLVTDDFNGKARPAGKVDLGAIQH